MVRATVKNMHVPWIEAATENVWQPKFKDQWYVSPSEGLPIKMVVVIAIHSKVNHIWLKWALRIDTDGWAGCMMQTGWSKDKSFSMNKDSRSVRLHIYSKQEWEDLAGEITNDPDLRKLRGLQ